MTERCLLGPRVWHYPTFKVHRPDVTRKGNKNGSEKMRWDEINMQRHSCNVCRTAWVERRGLHRVVAGGVLMVGFRWGAPRSSSPRGGEWPCGVRNSILIVSRLDRGGEWASTLTPCRRAGTLRRDDEGRIGQRRHVVCPLSEDGLAGLPLLPVAT